MHCIKICNYRNHGMIVCITDSVWHENLMGREKYLGRICWERCLFQVVALKFQPRLNDIWENLPWTNNALFNDDFLWSTIQSCYSNVMPISFWPINISGHPINGNTITLLDIIWNNLLFLWKLILYATN